MKTQHNQYAFLITRKLGLAKIPVGGVLLTTSGTARLINQAINTTPASELWLQNMNKLLESARLIAHPTLTSEGLNRLISDRHCGNNRKSWFRPEVLWGAMNEIVLTIFNSNLS